MIGIRTTPRRGACLFQLLAAFAVIGVLFTVGGIISMLTSGGLDAVADIQKSIDAFVADSKSFEAPGSIDIELPAGGGIIAFTPDGRVGDKQIGTPPPSVNYIVTIKDPAGAPVKFEANTAPRSPASPFALLGFFETKEKGLYNIQVSSANADDPHAAIAVAAGSQKQMEALLGSGLAILQGIGGSCSAACGVVLALACGIPALIMRKRRNKAPDPLEQM